ncbi:MAG TPA: Lrp/AsnC family transcriptional regulator [Thermoanaerobaculia bacterium]|jgi:Lrp/AsnC family leucine-responsive transcriptional regulator|nr:Lrp/AsnC family transcriptional regulator [Thermoanaerobaculia bacterium]
MIDDIDRKILNILQQNARVSNVQIAREVGMAPSAILERIRKLEARGVIRGYETRIDPEAVGLNLLAYIFVRSDERVGEEITGTQLARVPGVQEVHHIAGEDCYLVKVRTSDPKSLSRLLRSDFGSIESVRSTRTIVVLDTIREGDQLPMGLTGLLEPDPALSLVTAEVPEAALEVDAEEEEIAVEEVRHV